MPRLQRIKRFHREETGSLPVVFAFLMIPLVGMVGGAVDFGRAVSERTRLNGVLDAAVIVAAKAAQEMDRTNTRRFTQWTQADIKSKAEKAGTDYFNSISNLPAGTAPVVTVTLAGRTVSVVGSYSSSVPTSMLGILGIKSFPMTGNASSALDLSPMVDIYLLIDVSASMAIGATAADVLKLQGRFGCAFACHDGASFTEGSGRNKKTYADSFDWAQKNGVTLRINEVNSGIENFRAWLTSGTIANSQIRVGVYSFSNDLTENLKITSDWSGLSSNMPQAPSSSSETEGGTHFSDIMPAFAAKVGKGGDGITAPKKLVIIATDGVQDPNRLWSHAGNEWMRPQVRPFAPEDCRKLDSSVTVGVLYAPYIDLSPDWGFLDTLGKPSQIGGKGRRFDDIVPQLKACTTSANMFVDASTSSSVGDAFISLFKNYATVRLSQ